MRLWSPCASLWRVLFCLSLSPLLFFFMLYLLHHFILPVFFQSLHFTLNLIFYLSANPNIIVTHTNVYTLDMRACMNEHTNAYVCRHNCAYINVQTHAHRQYKDISSHTHTHSGRMVLSCTATHCVYAEPLSLLVERCYALLTSEEENIQSCPLVIN